MERGNIEGTINFNPIINEVVITDRGNVILAVFLGAIAMASLIGTIIYFNLNLENSLKATAMTALTFAIILFVLIKPSVIKNIKTKEIETIIQPIIHPVDRPVQVIKEVIREIEKPVIKEVIKNVFIEKPREKLNIPRYKFRGSTETRTYHKASCRFSKLIKEKYKVSRNDTKDFKKHGFRPCKVCKPNKDK